MISRSPKLQKIAFARFVIFSAKLQVLGVDRVISPQLKWAAQKPSSWSRAIRGLLAFRDVAW